MNGDLAKMGESNNVEVSGDGHAVELHDFSYDSGLIRAMTAGGLIVSINDDTGELFLGRDDTHIRITGNELVIRCTTIEVTAPTVICFASTATIGDKDTSSVVIEATHTCAIAADEITICAQKSFEGFGDEVSIAGLAVDFEVM